MLHLIDVPKLMKLVEPHIPPDITLVMDWESRKTPGVGWEIPGVRFVATRGTCRVFLWFAIGFLMRGLEWDVNAVQNQIINVMIEELDKLERGE